VFKHPPKLHFISVDRRSPAPSQIVFKLDPSTGIRMILDAHRSDHAGPSEIQLDMEFAQEGGEGATPYEVLLHAALIGDSTYFTRQDSVEECWRIVQPLLDSPPRCTNTRRVRGARRRATNWSAGSEGGGGRGSRRATPSPPERPSSAEQGSAPSRGAPPAQRDRQAQPAGCEPGAADKAHYRSEGRRGCQPSEVETRHRRFERAS
jgi:hypothetical protein